MATSYMLTECDITILKNIYYVGLKYVCQRIGIFDTWIFKNMIKLIVNTMYKFKSIQTYAAAKLQRLYKVTISLKKFQGVGIVT